MVTDELLFQVEQVVIPLLEQLGVRLVEREFLPEGGRWVLRLYIERRDEGPVTIADCQRVSGVVGPAIEVAGIVQRSYSLELSSPGINRPLRALHDFVRFSGEEIKLRTALPVKGRSNFRGELRGVEGEAIIMIVDGIEYRVPSSLLLKAHVVGKVEIGKGKKKEIH